MKSLWRGFTLVALLLALWTSNPAASAQVRTSAVSDIVYRADGTPAGGTVVISWNAFTTSTGDAVSAGSTTSTLGAGGALNVALAPNASATPMGSYYTVIYHLNDGTTSKEYWVVPAILPGGAPAKLAAIRNQVLPTTVAMQTVSKQYVDDTISKAVFGPLDTSIYVEKSGDTMTGPLTLPGDPVTSLEAADKNYVDTEVTAVTTGLAGKVALLPSVSQTVIQPTGTELSVNRLNGSLHAKEFQDSTGSFGLNNATAAPDCGVGCRVVIDPDAGGDVADQALLQSHQQFVDQRGGAERITSVDPLNRNDGTGSSVTTYQRQSAANYSANVGGSIAAATQALTMNAMTGGNNAYPTTPAPYFKSTYAVERMEGNYFTQGQHVLTGVVGNCWSVGDCIRAQQVLTSAGGFRDGSDEGTHQADILTTEQPGSFIGNCASGCTAGSTSLTINALYGGGTQGDGRYVINVNPAKDISTGSVISGSDDYTYGTGRADFSGTSFPASTFLVLAADATSQPNDIAPGTVTVPIATSGVPAGFATNTAALPGSSGLMCMVDPYPLASGFEPFEMVPYTVVDGTHLQLTLRKVHVTGTLLSVGGLCGYGISQTVDYNTGVRQVFPVLGSLNSTSLLYADNGDAKIGVVSSASSTAYANLQLTVAAISRSSNVVTVTLASPLNDDVNGLSMTISGVADSSYNGTAVVTSTGSNTLTYPNTGADSTSTGGTVSLVTGAYTLFPMVEVVSVYNPATNHVDGLFTLAPNAVNWETGDLIEEPHFYEMAVHGDEEAIVQYSPRLDGALYTGKVFQGEMGPSMNGWRMWNQVPTTEYLGGGGTHHPPTSAFLSQGVWKNNFDAEAGEENVMSIHCNLHGCNRWNSAYNLFALDANGSQDSLRFDPNTHTATWHLYGADYSFSNSAFTAGTINVGTLNATTISGGVSGSAITSGTIPAARLPIFGPSGSTHAPGAVPDPGAVAGSTRYLREDGTWSVPAGGSGGGGGSPTGTAGGDLSGSYPNPTVAAVHATSGTLDGVTIGGTTPATGKLSLAYVGPASGSDGDLILRTVDGHSLLRQFAGSGLAWGFGGFTSFFPTLAINTGTANPPSGGLAVGNSAQFQVTSTGDVSTSGTVTVSNAGPGFAAALYTPASSTAACTTGQFADDANFHYVCVSANTWKRVALSTF